MEMKRSYKLLGAFLLIVAGLLFYLNRPVGDFPQGSAGSDVNVTITVGENGTEIAGDLARQGVIKEASTFISLALRDKRARSIAPGVHRISTHIPTQQALMQLLDQKRVIGLVKVAEGSTLGDVLRQLSSSTELTHVANAAEKVRPLLGARSLEGEIYPAQYSFPPGTTTVEALTSMVDKFASTIESRGLNQNLGTLTPYQVLTIASMIQIEGDPGDYSKVARVIYNRLKMGMPLQLNSTVQYAANLRGRIQLSTAATNIDSPYNTYRRIGLPPTPICNPSDLAVSAARNPASGNWIYFITVKKGDTRFTDNYSTFQHWESEFHQNLAKGLFK
jgi:UPF0755 protein